MGYKTIFEGQFTLSQRLYAHQMLYLQDFSQMRHCRSKVKVLRSVIDPSRHLVELPLGPEADYFVNYRWFQENSDYVAIDYNRPPSGQPSLWCPWIPTADGTGIQWKPESPCQHYLPWLQYLIDHFLGPWGYEVRGRVCWQGAAPADVGEIVVAGNRIIMPELRDYLGEAIGPAQLPPQVYAGLVAVKAKDPTLLWSWIAATQEAELSGFPETATWIQENLREYLRLVERGFVTV
jgi:hypothetical protein